MRSASRSCGFARSRADLAAVETIDSIDALVARARHASSGRASAGSCRPSSTTIRATRSATWCSSSRAASGCPTSPTTARTSSPRSEPRTARFLERMLELAGLPDAGGARRAHLRPSRPRSRRSTGTTSSTRDSQATYNPLPLGRGRGARAGAAPLARAGSTRSTPRTASFAEVVVREPSFVEGLGDAARRGPPRGLDGLAAVAAHPLVRPVPARRGRRRRTSTSTARRSPARPSCARAGSAASRWSKAPWARRSAASTSSATSARPPRPRWTRSSRKPRRRLPRQHHRRSTG